MRARPLALTLALLLAGCAAERSSAPSDLLSAGTPFSKEVYKRAGITVYLPDGMQTIDRPAPAVFRSTFGDWYVAGFAYRRKEQLPRNAGELRAARRRLVAEVRRRDPKYRLVKARLTRSHGSPAIEVVGDQVLEHRRLRTRSVHVYKGRAEYVLEMAAPPAEFGPLDFVVFDRVADSLRVTGKPS